MTQFTAFPTVTKPAPVISQTLPVYKLLKPYYDKNDAFCEEGSYIQLRTEPNEHMEPMNTLAEIEMRKFLAKLDNISSGIIEKEVALTRLEKFEMEMELKRGISGDPENEEGLVGMNSFSKEAPISTLGAKKYQVGVDEYVTDKRLVEQQARMAKARATAAANRAAKKVTQDLA